MPVPPTKPPSNTQKPAATTKQQRNTSTTPVDTGGRTSSSTTKKHGPETTSTGLSRSPRQPTSKNTHTANGSAASPEPHSRELRSPSSPQPLPHRRVSNSQKPTTADNGVAKSSVLPQAAQNGRHTTRNRNHVVDDDEAEFAVIEEAAPEPLRRAVVQPSKHVGQPRIAAAAPAAPVLHPLPAANIRLDYDNDDFETYDDDFEEEFIEDDDVVATNKSATKLDLPAKTETESVPIETPPPPPSKPGTVTHADQHSSLKSAGPPVAAVNPVVVIEDEANVAALISTLQQRQQQYHSVESESGAVIDFHSAHNQQHSVHAQRAAARRAAKFSTIRRLVQFEVTHYRHFTLNPAGSHARYLELFGKQNVKLAASQTAEEHADEEIQTEVPEHFNVWTQHPALSANQVSDRDDPSNTKSFSTSNNNNMPSSSNVVSFIAQASECILKLLHENSRTTTSTNRRGFARDYNAVSLEGKSDVFASVLLVGPELTETTTIDYNGILCMACNEPRMDRIATCHTRMPGQQQSPSSFTADMTVILVWNINSPSTPEVALCTQDVNSRVTCCTFHKLDLFVVIAGCNDGSIQCWNTRATSTSTTLSSSSGSKSVVQFSSSNTAKTVNVPVVSAEFSTAPLGGGRWPPPHIAPVAALDEYVDINGGRRVGIADVSSSCTLASLDTCSTLCLWNVVSDSPLRLLQQHPRRGSASSGKDSKRAHGGPLSAATTTTADLEEFCVTPAALSSSSNNNTHAGATGSGTAGSVAVRNVLRLIPLNAVNILESTRISRFGIAPNSRPSTAAITTSTLPISYNSANCMARFCPYFFSSTTGGGGGGATTTVACLVDGRLYRVNNSSSRQLLGGYKTTAKVVDRTPRNVPASSIVSFAFPPLDGSSGSSSSSTVACLHDIGNVSFVSFDSGQLLQSWSSPLISSASNFFDFPQSPASFSDMQNLSFGQVAQSIWWPDSGVIILVGSDATAVKFDFANRDNGDDSSTSISSVLDGSIPQATIDRSMSKSTQQNNAGDNSRCVANFVGKSADANVTKLVMIASSGPIAMLQIKSHRTQKNSTDE